jgi:hypothetical protein
MFQPPVHSSCTACLVALVHLQAARQRRPAKKAAQGTQTGVYGGAAGSAGPLRGGLGFGALTACTGRRRKPHVSADDAAAPGSAPSPGVAGIEDASKWTEAADEVRMLSQLSAISCSILCLPHVVGGLQQDFCNQACLLLPGSHIACSFRTWHIL